MMPLVKRDTTGILDMSQLGGLSIKMLFEEALNEDLIIANELAVDPFVFLGDWVTVVPEQSCQLLALIAVLVTAVRGRRNRRR